MLSEVISFFITLRPNLQRGSIRSLFHVYYVNRMDIFWHSKLLFRSQVDTKILVYFRFTKVKKRVDLVFKYMKDLIMRGGKFKRIRMCRGRLYIRVHILARNEKHD